MRNLPPYKIERFILFEENVKRLVEHKPFYIFTYLSNKLKVSV
uniref:Uncharacterized protein n=1 Tax=Sphingobacterium sp. (strain 21) TaxID=743722 RepID=F4CBY5_SPHS2